MRKLGLVGALVLLAAACDSPTAPGDQGELSLSRTRWADHGSLSYSFEINRGCFCLMAGRRIRVTVSAGAVTAAQYLDSGGTVEPAFIAYLPTVPDLFDLVEDAITRQADVLSVSYDPYYGHPTRIQIDYSANAADDEITLTVSGLLLSEGERQTP